MKFPILNIRTKHPSSSDVMASALAFLLFSLPLAALVYFELFDLNIAVYLFVSLLFIQLIKVFIEVTELESFLIIWVMSLLFILSVTLVAYRNLKISSICSSYTLEVVDSDLKEYQITANCPDPKQARLIVKQEDIKQISEQVKSIN